MKQLSSFRFLIALLLLSGLYPHISFAQRTAAWELDDSVPMKYIAFRSNISAANSGDVALIAETNSFPLLHVVRHSTDGGATWNTLFFDTSKGTARWNTIVHNRPEQYMIAGDSELYLGMSGYNVLYRYQGFLDVSVDGGATWMHRDFDTNTVVSDVAMLTDSFGVALTHNVANVYDSAPAELPDSLFITTDGWHTVTAIAMPNGVQGCQQVFCFGVDTIGISGWTGPDGMCQYYKTTDGGKTWELPGTFPYVTHIQFLTPSHAWGAGTDFSTSPYRGLLIETTDGGVTWNTRMDTNLSVGFSSISFADSMHGLVVGQYILRTTDGGASWVEEYPPFGVVTPSDHVTQILETAADSAIGVFSLDPVIRFTGKYELSAPFFHSEPNSSPQPIAPITISWTPVAGATKYRLELDTEIFHTWKDSRHFFDHPTIDTTVSDTQLTISDPIVASFYYGRVEAISGSDTSDWRQNGYWFQIYALFWTVSKPELPLPPEIIYPPSGSHVASEIPMRITSVAGANSYDLEFWLQGTALELDTTVSDTSFMVSGLPAGFTYEVIVRANIPNDTTDWSGGQYYFYLDANGVNVPTRASDFVFPNPAKSIIHIEGATNGGHDLHLYDALGAEMQVPTSWDGSGATLDVRSLPSGLYTIEVTGSEPRFYRIVVAH